MSNLFTIIAHLGTSQAGDNLEKKNIMLLNWINLLLFLSMISILALEVILFFMELNALSYGSYRIFLIAMVGLVNLLLVYKGHIQASKISLIVFPAFIFGFFPSLFGHILSEFFLYVPYGIIAMSIIPHYVLAYSREKRLFWFSILLFFTELMLHDVLMLRVTGDNLAIVPIMEDNYLFYKVSHLAIFAFINLAIFYLRNQNQQYESRLEKAYNELQNKARTIHEQREELQAQNEELEERRQELKSQNEQLRSTQDQLVHSEKMASLGILTAGVAHEINNPINFIYNGSVAVEQHMSEKCPEQLNEIRPFLEAINTGVSRAYSIVKSLNKYSRSKPWNYIEYDLHEVVEDCLTMLYNQHKDHVEIKREFAGVQISVMASEGQLHQAFLNILSNAIQAIDGRGTVTIRTRLKNETAEVAMSDNGQGISPEDQKKIFDPFFTTKDPGKGTGLGLSITQKIIYEHNGSINFQSALNKGSVFTVHFPL